MEAPRFVDSVCPGCDEFHKGHFTPCDWGDGDFDDAARARRPALLEKYQKLVDAGKLKRAS